MAVQVQEIKGITLKLKNLRFPLLDEYQAIVILIALPHKWSTLHTIILNKTGSLSLQDTVNSILKHAEWETALLAERESRHEVPYCIPPMTNPLKCLAGYSVTYVAQWKPHPSRVIGILLLSLMTTVATCIVSSKTVSWGLKLLCYPLCLQGSDTEEQGVLVKCN